MIYCVEDNAAIREIGDLCLWGAGYAAEGCADGAEFFRKFQPAGAELVLLDVMLPGEDGLQILKKLRADPAAERLPVIMLTALSSEIDKVRALDLGADDYLTKPFGMMELLARIRAVLRRCRRKTARSSWAIIALEPRSYTAAEDGMQLTSPSRNLSFWRILMENCGRVPVGRSFWTGSWGIGDGIETRTLDTHVRSLRQKLGEQSGLIETVRAWLNRIGKP
jgi:two-component system alkaline phosphatase synthesis response regulator PhoP